MNKKLIIPPIIFMLLIIGLSGCNEQGNNPINPPKFTITGQTSSEGYEGADRVGYVEITVKNNGGKGSQTINVRVTQGSDYWTKSQSVSLDNGETRNIKFTFKEIKFWTLDPWEYNAWIE